MTPDEVPDFLNQISVADPRILPTDPKELMGMAAIWAVALTDVPVDFALQAVGQHYEKSPFTIKPSDIAIRWRATARQRLEASIDPLPTADPNDEVTYRRQLRAGRVAVAQGTPLPPTVRALTPSVAYDDVRAMRAQGDLLEFIKLGMKEGRAKADARKALILRHPDLAKRLTEPPLGYQRPDQWSGAIPPETWNGVANDSPLRPVLLDLIAEAERREAS